MPLALAKEPFDQSKLYLVRDFFCGDELWARLASDWIKSPITERDSALSSIRNRDTKIWLYFDPANRLVGFGSLGRTQWSWPLPDGPKTEVSFIPQMAVALDFQGEPVGQGEIRYSHQILHDLIEESMSHGTDKLVLLVHPDNHPARRIYAKHDFLELPHHDRHGNIKCIRLIR